MSSRLVPRKGQASCLDAVNIFGGDWRAGFPGDEVEQMEQVEFSQWTENDLVFAHSFLVFARARSRLKTVRAGTLGRGSSSASWTRFRTHSFTASSSRSRARSPARMTSLAEA
jgi:hypothetical protein